MVNPMFGKSRRFHFARKITLLVVTCHLLAVCLGSDHGECGVYLAESSIKDGGWGVFAGKNFTEGDFIGDFGVAVRIESFFPAEGLLKEFLTDSTETSPDTYFLHGLQKLANYHSTLANSHLSETELDNSFTENDPMKGSYSITNAFFLRANTLIQQGQEILLEGDNEWLNKAGIPLHEEYAKARKIVDSLVNFQSQNPSVSEEHWIDILYRMKNEMVENKTAANLLPSTLEELRQMTSYGLEVTKLIPRDMSWIKKHGYCLDNVQEGISTISGAGRGAFATKAFEKDSIITVAPLVHLKHSDLYTKTTENESTFQMLLNYCFGHRKSDILLCPVSNIALINHNSKEPNAKIQWSKPSQNRIDADTNYRTKGLNELSNNGDDLKFFNTKLAIEIVAIKAIEVGEEIFLNYGQEWEVAMMQHVEFWSRTKSTLQNDQNHPSRPVFRHYIPFPDTLFPFRWREDYAGGGKLNLGIPKIGLDLTLSENEHHHEIHESMLRSVECGIYFAPSNIPNAGFGTFTAVPVAGKGIVTGTHMPAIPVIDNFPRKWNGNDYVWNSESYFAEYESSRLGEENILGTSVLAVHEGALANSHLGLVNEYLQSPTFDPVLDRCKDPGAGAFSDYVRYSFKSENALQIGQELFVTYGDAWFEDRSYFSDVPVTKNWKEVNKLLSSVWMLSNLEGVALTRNQVMSFLDVLKDAVVGEHRTKMALNTVKTYEGFMQVFERNGAAQATFDFKTQDWLKENGQCLDHVYVKESSIKQAGMGGFSRRFLKKGDLIIAAPLITAFGEDMMQGNLTKLYEAAGTTDINEFQLFLNYQFTHPQSSVYFFPITHAFIFNHNSERMTDGKKPNAILRWANWSKKSNYFLQRSLDDLRKELYSTMVLDVVATRDIYPDEEIFIDYGAEWEAAWKRHVENWKSPCENKTVFSSFKVRKMNEDKFVTDFHEWSEDHFSVCRISESRSSELIHLIEESEGSIGETNGNVMTSFRGITYDHIGFQYAIKRKSRIPCIIIGFDANQMTFDVASFQPSMTSTIPEFPNARILQIAKSVPESEVEFLNRPFRSDMHWKGAFRHPINIPDEIFPKQWKDLSQ